MSKGLRHNRTDRHQTHYLRRGLISKPWVAFAASLLLIAGLVVLLYWKPGQHASGPAPTPLVIYCAAGLQKPVEEVAREYEQAFHVPIQFQYGGSGTLLSSLRVARRGDLFLAADNSYIEEARRQKLVAESIPLARMKPVIVVKKGNPKKIADVADLLRADVAVALANPDAAAIGRVTRGLLQKSGQWEALAQRTKVYKPTVNDVVNDVKLPGIDAGIVWDAVAGQYPELESVHVADFDTARELIAIGVVTDTPQPAAALRFARYLGACDKGLLVLKKLGFDPVEGDPWKEQPKLTLFSGAVNRVAIQDTIKSFEQREGVSVTVVYNGCGILTAQMRAMTKGEKSEAFPDAYFACDVSFMNTVQDLFLDSLNVSETDMVILTAKGNPKGIKTVQDLARPELRLGLADGRKSALGALCDRMLDQLGIRDAVNKNVKTLTATADILVADMRAGALDATIVYKANTSGVGDALEILPIPHPSAKAIQPFATSKESRHKQTAARLLAAITSPESRKKYEHAGFRFLPGSDKP